MKVKGYIVDGEILANLDTTELVSELLKNKEYVEFNDKRELFDLILQTIEKQNNEIEKLNKNITELKEEVSFHKMISGKYFRYFEILIQMLIFVLLIYNI